MLNKKKLKKNSKYLISALILLIIIFIFVFYPRSANSSQESQFPLSSTINPQIYFPENIFMTVPTLYIKGWAIMDFIKMKNIYTWEINKSATGDLNFRILINKKKTPDKSLPKFIRFELFSHKGKNATTIWSEDIVSDMWKSEKKFKKKTRFSFSKLFNFPVKLAQKDLLVFKISFPEDYTVEDIDYGITIPSIKLKIPLDLKKQENPNLILISIDTLRSDYLGIYKKLRNEPVEFSYSPNLDSFANNAVVFKNTYTPLSATWPALNSMFTSLYPSEHGVTYNGMNSEHVYNSIATHMLELGYNTRSLLANAGSLNIPGILLKSSFFNNDFKLLAQSLFELQNQNNVPFFHWYHLMGTHSEYTPKKWGIAVLGKGKKYKKYNTAKIMRKKIPMDEEELEKIRTLYAAELYCLDFELKKIFDYLKANKMWDKSMIVVVSDHGEDLYERNKYFYHYPSLYDSSLKIPLMIKFPYQKKRIVIEEMASLLDLFPTIADYFRSKDKKSMFKYDLSGLSLLPLLKGNNKDFTSRTLFANVEKNQIVAALKNGWKLIFNPKEITPETRFDLPYPYTKLGLYNSNTDPNERNNIYKENSKLVSKFIKSIKNYLKKKGSLKSGKLKQRKYENDPETLKRLRTLGYIK